MRRIRFWVKADHDTSLGILLTEKKPGGGNYAATVWAAKNVWQRGEVALSDFIANDGPGDPINSDGKLDPDQVEAVGLLDLSAIINQMADNGPMFVAKKSGLHTADR